MSLSIFVNSDAKNLTNARCQGVNDLGAISFRAQAAGDKVPISLSLTGKTGAINLQTYSSVRLGIGPLNGRPESGTYTFDSLASPLSYNHTAAQLDVAITAQVAGCAVIELAPFVFKITFDAVGAQTLPTVDATLLDPASSVNVTRLVTGDGSTKGVWLWRLFRNPIALTTTWTNSGTYSLTGVLNLGTTGVYDLLDGKDSTGSIIELELTDSDGNITTVMQQAYTINGEVIGNGAIGVAEFDNYATPSDLISRQRRGNLVFVDAVFGDNATAAVERIDLPYLTCVAAQTAAATGDLIIVRPGDYSGESALVGKNDVHWLFNHGAIGPAFAVVGAFTFTIEGYQGSYISNTGTANTVTVNESIWTGDGASVAPLNIGSSAVIRVFNSVITSTESGGEVVAIAASSSGALLLSNTSLLATTVATDEATKGILYGASVTANVQLKSCTIITAKDGTGTAKSIDAPAAQTIYVQGSLNQTHAVDSDITLAGGVTSTNTNYTA